MTDNHGASTTSAPITITVDGRAVRDLRDDDARARDRHGVRRLQGGLEVHRAVRRKRDQGDRVPVRAGCRIGLAAGPGGDLRQLRRQPRRPARRVQRGDDHGQSGVGLGGLHLPDAGRDPRRHRLDRVHRRDHERPDTDPLRLARRRPAYNAERGYAAGRPNPFGAATTIGFHYSLYATYSPAGGNQPPVPTISSPSSIADLEGRRPDHLLRGRDRPRGRHAAGIEAELVGDHPPLRPDRTDLPHPLRSRRGTASRAATSTHPTTATRRTSSCILTATDSQGTSTSTSVTPAAAAGQPDLRVSAARPSGRLRRHDAGRRPYTVGAIIGSTHSISAPATQTVGGTTYTFSSWSDGGAATHNITAPATAATYTATYTVAGGGNNSPTAVASAHRPPG